MNTKIIKISALICAALLIISCAQKKKSGNLPQRTFPMVTVPGIIVNPGQRAEYMTVHYWDAFLDTATVAGYLCDSSHCSGVERRALEQVISNYASAFDYAGPQVWKKSMERLYSRLVLCRGRIPGYALADSISALVDLYLYDPNSPVRNEDAYGYFLKAKAGDESLSREERLRADREADLCALCSVGTPAADFRFFDKNGKEYRMSEFTSPFTVLFFSNPGCHACREIRETLTGNEFFDGLTDDGTISVLNVYVDEELDEWFKYMNEYPDNWYNGYEPDYVVRGDVLYHLRAIPSLYLLDKDKTVLLKDTTPQKIILALDNLLQ
ncbi:MAG: DUF5106 domain-containing protein [Bacteroidales bacterium]|nr:DUF5106 domain-containing protein [Bacteroidales bacterium]